MTKRSKTHARTGTIAATAVLALTGMTRAGETLYNGIELPDRWPPKRKELKREPMPLPYLKNPPKVIPIDVGRQLLVDDFLIEKSDLKRTFHRPTYPKTNPIIKADQPWETSGKSYFVAPFQGRVLYDPSDQLFKMWYLHSTKGDYYCNSYGYATSKDGIHWDKPAFTESKKPDANSVSPKKGTNLVLQGRRTCCNSVILDHNAKSPDERFKMFSSDWINRSWNCVYRTSPDGIHWSGPLVERRVWGDYVLAFYNPFRRMWVYEGRIHGGAVGRCRAYMEDPDPRKLAERVLPNKGMNLQGDSVYWVGADDLDPRNPDPRFKGIKPQLYSLAVAPYESLMLGLFAIWTGPDNATVKREGLQKRNDILTGFSRDGFHWDRPDREPFISPSWKKGTWNFGNAQPVGGCCLVVGDTLYIYFSARMEDKTGMHGNATTGLALLRRDGFASLDAGDQAGSMTTRPITFKGKHLFVNADCPKGNLRVEVLDKDGKVIEPFALKNCKPLACDKTLAAVTWQGVADLSALSGKPVRFRFHLKSGSLYAFWVSPAKSGASHGYVAAGGPGFKGATDTVGQGASMAAGEKPIRIGLQKQVFIDDAVIHRRQGVVRRVQPAAKMKKPVLTPERPWEFSYLGESGDPGIGKRIYVYGTVFFDPLQKQYRMWYMSRMSRGHNHKIPELKIPGGGNRHCDLTLYASSKDGITWQRPDLGLVRFNGSGQNNIMLDFHGASVFLDQEESDPQKRYKAIGFIRRHHAIRMCHSPDGIHWSDPEPAGDRKNEGSFNVCYVPSLGRYVAGSIERSSDARYEFRNWQGKSGRKRVIATLRTEGKDLRRWEKKTFIYPDDKDDPNTQFYGMTPLVYGDLVLGFLHVFHNTGPGPGNDDGPIDVQLVYSRDGRTWHRLEDRRPVISPGRKGSFDGGMVMMTANGAFARGDEFIAYYTAANTTHGALVKDKRFSIGRASWRRDRLVALEAKDTPGTVVTRPFRLEGSELEVNVDARAGWVQVELLDENGKAIRGFSGKTAKTYKGVDELRLKPQWKSGGDVSQLKGKTAKLRFALHNAKLYSFSFK